MSLPLPNTTQIPNDLFDNYMDQMGLPELKVTLAVIRHTLGADRPASDLSIRYLARYCGLSQNGALAGAAAAVRRGLIKRDPGNGGDQATAVYRPAFTLPHRVRQGASPGEASASRGEAGGASPGEASASRGEAITHSHINTHSLTADPSLDAYLSAYGGEPPTLLVQKTLTELCAQLGETEYRRLIQWGASRRTPATAAQLRRAAARWKPEWTPEQREAKHASRNTPNRNKPHGGHQPAARPANNRPSAERLSADRKLAEERRRKARGVA